MWALRSFCIPLALSVLCFRRCGVWRDALRGTKKERAALSRSPFKAYCSFLILFSKCFSSSLNNFSNSAVNSGGVNNLYSVNCNSVNCLSLLSTVTARSERNSCNSYEHEC